MAGPSAASISDFEHIRDLAVSAAARLERWPSYYERRFLEFLSYRALFPNPELGHVLELGSGIGYQSALLAKLSNRLIATDLPDENLGDHAPGMQAAREFLALMKVDNVEFRPCSAENLPFEDACFDMVFSSHVLEHIPDQGKALKEIYRVLKPGGYHFCVVPTSTEKIYAFMNYYTYLLVRLFHHLARKVQSKFRRPLLQEQDLGSSLRKNAMSQLKYFPFPPPHGHSKHYLAELLTWTPSSWSKKVVAAAPFIIEKQCTTQVNPLLSWLGAIVPKKGTAMHSMTRKFELKIGQWPVVRSMGMNTVMICRKPLQG